jgi:membrane-associated phospholipid phosphatase
VGLVAVVLAVAVLRLEAQEVGYLAAFAVAAGTLYLARGLGDVRWWGAYVLGFLAFAYVRTFADEFAPWQYGYVVEIEELVGFGRVPSVWLQEQWFSAGETSWFDRTMFAVYISYFVAPQLAGILVWRASRERFRRYVVATLATFYVGLLIGFALPTAPPWLAAQEGYIPALFRVIVELTAEADASARDAGYSLASANPVAAMPSLHLGITAIVALAWWRSPLLRVAGALYVAVMALALVYLGEHYVADLVAGLALGLAGWWAAGWWLGRRASLAGAAGR